MNSGTIQNNLIIMCNEALVIINLLSSYKRDTKFYVQLVCICKSIIDKYKTTVVKYIDRTIKFCEIVYKQYYTKYREFYLIDLKQKFINRKIVVPTCQNLHIFNNATNVYYYYSHSKKNVTKPLLTNNTNIMLCRYSLNQHTVAPVTQLVNDIPVYFNENKYVYNNSDCTSITMKNNHALQWYAINCNWRNIDLETFTFVDGICNCAKVL